MLISSLRQPVQLLLFPFILILLLGRFAVANDALDEALSRTLILQSAEVNFIETQLELERWKHSQIEELHANGFASWLELRRHQFNIDSMMTRLKTARDIQDFLNETIRQKQKVSENRQIVFRDRQSSPIRVFSPDSIRLIGWIEGQLPVESGAPEPNEAAINATREKLANAQKRYDATNHPDFVGANFREKAKLELAIAQRELEYVQALDSLQVLSKKVAGCSVSVDQIENYVTATQNDALRVATLTVKKAEAAASGHIQSAQIRLVREKRRADAIRRLHSQGHASNKELAIVEKRLAKINSQLNTFARNRETLNTALRTTDDSIEQTITFSSDSVEHWPAIVFSDREFAMHLVGLRREVFEEKTNRETARLKVAFFQQVLERLKAVATNSNSDTEFGSNLNQGRLNEIESYEIDIEFGKASLAATIEKQTILACEENRFIQQIVALNDAAGDEIVSSETPSWEVLGMMSRFLPATVMAYNGNPGPRTRFSYLESGDLIAAGRSTNLSFAQSNLRFVDSPYSCKSLQFFNPTPVRSPLFFCDSRRPQISSPKYPRFERERIKSFSDNSFETLRLSGTPYVDGWPQKIFYGQYGYRAFGGTYGYPNGILRADWRINTTPGDVPWHAPGSPADLRANQLYYRRDSQPYQRW